MNPVAPRKPGRNVLTYLGLAGVGVAVCCFVLMMGAQYAVRGTFDKGDRWVLGFLGAPMLCALCVGFPILLVGAIIDAARFDRWMKRSGPR